ncbi:MAG: ATP-binding protein [Anaerolineales bacterium]
MSQATDAHSLVDGLIGRQREWAELSHALYSARAGKGGLLLLAGEAGVGKTRLADECLKCSGLLTLSGAASEHSTPPYGPLIAALRAYLRLAPQGFAPCRLLIKYLALILPELGLAPAEGDRAALFESIRCALATIARAGPAVLFFDDLQWADNATLELLPPLASELAEARLLIVGVYRSDEIPRGHPIRKLRHDLRRARQLREIAVEPLDRDATAELAARVLNQEPGPALATMLFDRTQGLPLFVEELAGGLVAGRRLQTGKAGMELIAGAEVPIPDTLRDAVLLRLDGLAESARRLIEIAAAIGLGFDLEIVTELAGADEGLDSLLERNLIVEREPGHAAFRHALTREAIYGEITWTRRRALHRQIASALAARKAPAEVVAEHWLAARENDQARRALIIAAQKSSGVHAYRDAARAAQRALELWPEGEDEAGRLVALDQLGQCAQLSGMPSEAARAWREAAEGRRQSGDLRRFAETQRQLATVYELQNAREQAVAARQSAAEAFTQSRLPGEAAAERIAIVWHVYGASGLEAAERMAALSVEEARQANRPDLTAIALAYQGEFLALQGQYQAGIDLVRTGLTLALEHALIGTAAEVHKSLASVYEYASDYGAERKAYETAIDFCQSQGLSPQKQHCLGCFTYVLFQTGEWERAITLGQAVIASEDAPRWARAVATGMSGMIYAQRGEARRARKLILEWLDEVRRLEKAAVEPYCLWGLAVVDELEGANDLAAEHCRSLIALRDEVDERHDSIPALRWVATFFALRGDGAAVRQCANGLARMSAATGNPEALAGLAHALGEAALLEGDAARATEQFGKALELLTNLEVPLEHAETEWRLGVARAKLGQPEAAVSHFINAYRAANTLGARPLVARIVQELEALGESIVKHLGQRAARQLEQGGLTRRQIEIVRLIAQGFTNQEIARELVLSTRTVDMHVGSLLARLDCRTRAEAVRKASELGLLD